MPIRIRKPTPKHTTAARDAAVIEFYEAYLATRRDARVLLRLILEHTLHFLESEDARFTEAARRVKARPYRNGEDQSH
jgi:hypothetical protein